MSMGNVLDNISLPGFPSLQASRVSCEVMSRLPDVLSTTPTLLSTLTGPLQRRSLSVVSDWSVGRLSTLMVVAATIGRLPTRSGRKEPTLIGNLQSSWKSFLGILL